jgi:MarR family transcriptional regulator, organic hydroperoxide resistance regulator
MEPGTPGRAAPGDLRRLFSDVQRLHAQLAVVLNARLRGQFGLSLVLFEPMSVMADMDRCRVGDLAAELSMSAGTASKLVDRLEAAGYCRRLLNPDDRRSSLLELTAAGRRICDDARRAVDEELDRRLGETLPAARASELAASLRVLRSAGR